MSDYTLFCTVEQTKKDLALGAPIEYASDTDVCCGNYFSMTRNEEPYRVLPTAEQMIGFLLDNGIADIVISRKMNPYAFGFNVWYEIINGLLHEEKQYSSRKEATLAAIDAALDYLIERKKK